MKSQTLDSFWNAYRFLLVKDRRSARKDYCLWRGNLFIHLYIYKCINSQEDVWSVRINRSYRAIGILDKDTVTWFWIGNHDDYEQFFG